MKYSITLSLFLGLSSASQHNRRLLQLDAEQGLDASAFQGEAIGSSWNIQLVKAKTTPNPDATTNPLTCNDLGLPPSGAKKSDRKKAVITAKPRCNGTASIHGSISTGMSKCRRA